MGIKIYVWDDEVLEMDSGDGCPTLRVYSMPLNCMLKVVNYICVVLQ